MNLVILQNLTIVSGQSWKNPFSHSTSAMKLVAIAQCRFERPEEVFRLTMSKNDTQPALPASSKPVKNKIKTKKGCEMKTNKKLYS